MTGFTIDDALLTRMAARTDAVVPEGELVFFGIRGLLPLDVNGTPFAAAHQVRLTDVDHLRMRCTLGQWNRANRTIALFPGSTVPARPAIATARAANGVGANMLMLGRYRYQKGIHKADSPRGHRAFRQAMFFPVWRTRDDLEYDLADDIDLGAGADSFVFDNLHCAFCDNIDIPKFSSNGCQVVSGAPRAAYRNDAPETGPWARFIANAYDGAPKQSAFTYLLFSGTEAAAADNAAGTLVRSLRFGSSGDQVLRVQQALRSAGFDFLEADGGYGRDTLRAVMAFQRRTFGTGSVDGVVGPNTATALGLEWPTVARRTPVTDDEAPAIPADWIAAAVAITPGFEVRNDPYKGVSGDFDGMGISCGALQWNIGQGSLQPMVIAAGEQHVCTTMPQRGPELWRACTAPVRDGLQIVRQWQPGGKLPAATRTELATLMASAPVRRQQDQRIAAVATRAFAAATRWATSAGRVAASKREFLWFFDLVTQNGGLDGIDYGDVRSFVQRNGEGKADDVICDFLAALSGNSGHVKDAARNAQAWRDHATDDRMELLVLSYLRSGTADPRWRHVVLNRKGTIAMGRGWVNGTQHDFARLGI